MIKQTTRTAEICVLENGILCIKVIPNSLIDAEDALDNILVIKNLSESKKTLKLIDLRGNWSMSKKAEEYSKNYSRANNTVARAYIIDSFISKILLDFFQVIKTSDVPEKYFNQESEAIEWLLSQK